MSISMPLQVLPVSTAPSNWGPRLVTRADLLVEHQAAVSFVLLDNLVLSLRTVMSRTGLDLAELLIYATILTANRQRGARAQGNGARPGQTELLVPISQSAVARATGIPRETVRRKLVTLAAMDLIMMTEAGCVVTGHTLASELPTLLEMSALLVRSGNNLIDLGAITLESPRQARSNDGTV